MIKMAVYAGRLLQTFVILEVRKLLKLTNVCYKGMVFVSKNAAIRTSKGGEIKIGTLVEVGPNAEISAHGGKILIDGHNYINRNTMIISHEKIEIGEGTTIGPNCCIYDHDHDSKVGGGVYLCAN